MLKLLVITRILNSIFYLKCIVIDLKIFKREDKEDRQKGCETKGH